MQRVVAETAWAQGRGQVRQGGEGVVSEVEARDFGKLGVERGFRNQLT